MIHHLTIGFLDPASVSVAKVVSLAPIPQALLAVLQSFLDDGQSAMEGQPVVIENASIRCPWWIGSLRIRTAERFARIAHDQFGCTIADVQHGRIIPLSEFDVG